MGEPHARGITVGMGFSFFSSVPAAAGVSTMAPLGGRNYRLAVVSGGMLGLSGKGFLAYVFTH
jgi:hypothetical protein